MIYISYILYVYTYPIYMLFIHRYICEVFFNMHVFSVRVYNTCSEGSRCRAYRAYRAYRAHDINIGKAHVGRKYMNHDIPMHHVFKNTSNYSPRFSNVTPVGLTRR